jgi:hypothetical protein
MASAQTKGPYTDSIVNIDSQFQVRSGSSWDPTGYVMGDRVTRAWTGDMHVVAQYRKETFTLTFNNLSQYMTDILEQLVISTSTVLHTVEVITQLKRRIWDGTTASSGGTNSDIGRVRNKVYFKSFKKANYQGVPNVYQVVIECEES